MGTETPRKMIHVSIDAFFASMEQRDDPAPRGRPVAVGHVASRGGAAAAACFRRLCFPGPRSLAER
ncbi:hypothetical protein [Brevundimonas sp. ZS04]|uniref:Y-family DNA polymerase n=1 Tax=Brevundimonas sp. ZS04 TaxID=1906854 RepID=UPI0035112DBE